MSNNSTETFTIVRNAGSKRLSKTSIEKLPKTTPKKRRNKKKKRKSKMTVYNLPSGQDIGSPLNPRLILADDKNQLVVAAKAALPFDNTLFPGHPEKTKKYKISEENALAEKLDYFKDLREPITADDSKLL